MQLSFGLLTNAIKQYYRCTNASYIFLSVWSRLLVKPLGLVTLNIVWKYCINKSSQSMWHFRFSLP